MSLSRLHVALAATAASLLAAWLLAPTRAQSQATAPKIPCGLSWEHTTHGGDWFTVHGEATFSQIAPQGDGRFVAIGSGTATVTFHPGGACTVTNGDTWMAGYMVTMESNDGRNATVDIASLDEEHEFKLLCPGLIRGRGVSKLAETSSDYTPPELPSVTVPLSEGVHPFSKNYAGDRGSAGDAGSVTLRYCN